MTSAIEASLRSEEEFAIGRGRVPWTATLVCVIGCGVLYGAAMGSFGAKPHGAAFSASKVPVLVLGSAALGLPFLYVLNSSLGLRRDFSAVVRGILASQTTLAVCLASLAPVVLFFYASGVDYPTALLSNLAAFGLASLAGQVTLARHYRPLLDKNRLHRIGLSSWLALYLFIAIKLGWILRPLVGDPRLPTRYFREQMLDENPYMLILATVLGFVVRAWRAL